MSELLNTTIREVLIRDGRVALPGLGTLVREHQSATLNGADRKISPPGATVVFRDNLVLSDGRLVRSLVEKKGLLRKEAEAELQRLVDAIKVKLAAEETVHLEGVGRLRKQQDGNITFSAAGQDFSKRDAGLPSVSFTPINRRTRKTATEEDPLAPTPAARQADTGPIIRPPRREVDDFGVNLPDGAWYVIVTCLILLGLWALYLLFGLIAGTVTDKPRKPVTERIESTSTAPAPRPLAPAPAPVDASTITPEEPPRLNTTRNSANPDPASVASSDTTKAFTAEAGAAAGAETGGSNVALIATGLFGNEANVRKNVLRIEQAGFDAFTEKAGLYTRIGVRATYNTDTERDRILENVRREFTTDAFVMYINGTRVK